MAKIIVFYVLGNPIAIYLPIFALMQNRQKLISAFLLCIHLLPVIGYVYVGVAFGEESASKYFFSGLFSTVLFTTVFLWFGKKAAWFLYPIVPIGLVYLFFITKFHNYPGWGIYYSVLETSFRESSELVLANLPFLLFAILLIAIYSFLTIRFKPLLIPRKFKFLITGFLLFLTLFALVRDIYISRSIRYPNSFSKAIRDGYDQFTLKFDKIYPLDVIRKSIAVKRYNSSLSQRSKLLKDFTFDVSITQKCGKEVALVIIGEAARSDRFSINGYSERTNPGLEQFDLVSFKQAFSNANLTSISLPMIFTTAAPGSFDKFNKQGSLVQLFKEAGFETFWIGNQGRHTLIDQISSEAHHRMYLSEEMDSKLLPLLDSVLDFPNEKKLVVLHTMGSHFRYNQRYPESFRKFIPDMRENKDYRALLHQRNKELLSNSYDNSILFTDHIISSCLDKIKKQEGHTSVTYFSDHGESLFEEPERLILHGTPEIPEEQVHVPLIFWCSDSLERSMLQQNQHVITDLGAVLYTLSDLHHIRFSDFDSSRSLLNQNFKKVDTIELLDINYQRKNFIPTSIR